MDSCYRKGDFFFNEWEPFAVFTKDGKWFTRLRDEEGDIPLFVPTGDERISASEADMWLREWGLWETLTPKEISSLSLTKRERIIEALQLQGLEVGDLEEYCRVSYKLGANPLPALREFFRQEELQVSIKFAYRQPGTFFFSTDEGGPDIIIWLDSEDGKVEVEINC